MDEFDEHGEPIDSEPDFEYEFQLLNTEDPNTLILVCNATREMTPDEYAEALMEYAEQIVGERPDVTH